MTDYERVIRNITSAVFFNCNDEDYWKILCNQCKHLDVSQPNPCAVWWTDYCFGKDYEMDTK